MQLRPSTLCTALLFLSSRAPDPLGLLAQCWQGAGRKVYGRASWGGSEGGREGAYLRCLSAQSPLPTSFTFTGAKRASVAKQDGESRRTLLRPSESVAPAVSTPMAASVPLRRAHQSSVAAATVNVRIRDPCSSHGAPIVSRPPTPPFRPLAALPHCASARPAGRGEPARATCDANSNFGRSSCAAAAGRPDDWPLRSFALALFSFTSLVLLCGCCMPPGSSPSASKKNRPGCRGSSRGIRRQKGAADKHWAGKECRLCQRCRVHAGCRACTQGGSDESALDSPSSRSCGAFSRVLCRSSAAWPARSGRCFRCNGAIKRRTGFCVLGVDPVLRPLCSPPSGCAASLRRTAAATPLPRGWRAGSALPVRQGRCAVTRVWVGRWAVSVPATVLSDGWRIESEGSQGQKLAARWWEPNWPGGPAEPGRSGPSPGPGRREACSFLRTTPAQGRDVKGTWKSDAKRALIPDPRWL